MYDKVRFGGSFGEYANHRAAREIEQAYRESRSAGKSRRETVAAMTEVIERQVRNHEYISLHLRGEAADVSVRNLSHEEQEIVLRIAKDAGAEAASYEWDPPHIHIQFHD